MIAFLVATIVISAVLVSLTGQLRFVLSPLGVLPLWAVLRFQTPRDGMAVTTIRSTPGAVVLLWFSAATIVVTIIVTVIDIYLLGHPFYAPLEPYHAILFAPSFIVMFTGAFWASRIEKQSRDSST